MLKIEHIKKSFDNTCVLRDVSFSVESKGVLGLAGGSGSGKTTLLRCIQGLETPDSGEIFCDGSAGYMFQDFQLFPHMTVLENLVYAPKLHDKEKDHEARAKSFLKKLGISHKDQSFPNQLSGGQKQRVAFARTLMMSPEILLCDEPTSGLDIISVIDVEELLKDVRDMGYALVIASHDLNFLCNVADRIVVLKEGEINASVSAKSIKNPIQYLRKHY